MKNNILNVIKTKMPEMSKGQKRISDYILNHYDKAAYMTASKLGEVAGVSESTVVRYAIELGFDGYPELVHTLQEAVRSVLTSVQRIEVTDERIGTANVLEKTLLSDIVKIKATLECNDNENFDLIINDIINAKNIYIAGARASSMLAEMLSYNLNLIFDNVRHIDTAIESNIFEQMLRINKEDVLIAITFPRYSKRIIKTVAFARENNARIIGITDSESSPIAANSDRLLFAQSDMASYMDSLVAPLSLINAIVVAISRKKKDELSGIFDRLEKVWDEYEVYEKDSGNNV